MKIILTLVIVITLSIISPAFSGAGDKYICKEVTLNTIYVDKVFKYKKPNFSFFWAVEQKINVDGFLSFWNLPLAWEYNDYAKDGFEGFSSMSELGDRKFRFSKESMRVCSRTTRTV
jgi:hypothetical protein